MLIKAICLIVALQVVPVTPGISPEEIDAAQSQQQIGENDAEGLRLYALIGDTKVQKELESWMSNLDSWLTQSSPSKSIMSKTS